MIQRFISIGLLLALAQPASALSCQAPSIAATFAEVNAAEETYIMVRGTFTPLPGEQTEAEGGLNDKQPYDVRTRFQGDMATARGFDRALDIPVVVEIGCAGAWCGAVPDGEMIAFLEQRSGFYVLAAGPCPFAALPASPESEAMAMSCIRAEACEVETP